MCVVNQVALAKSFPRDVFKDTSSTSTEHKLADYESKSYKQPTVVLQDSRLACTAFTEYMEAATSTSTAQNGRKSMHRKTVELGGVTSAQSAARDQDNRCLRLAIRDGLVHANRRQQPVAWLRYEHPSSFLKERKAAPVRLARAQLRV